MVDFEKEEKALAENSNHSIVDSDEKRTNINLNVKEFSPEAAYLELPEELNDKVIHYIEGEVRRSYEYKKYINYLKNELDLTSCSIMENLNIKEAAFRLEFHHYPMNLFEIVETVGKSILAEKEKVSCFEIANKVTEEHFRNNIGLVPLSLSMHKAAHNKSIFIPLEKVNGNYKEFIQKYNEFISQDIKDRITEAEINQYSDDGKNLNKAKLEKNVINLNIEYFKEGENE